MNLVKKKAIIIALVGLAAGVIIGLITKNLIVLFGIAVNGGFIAFATMFPYWGRKKVMKSIWSGYFFASHTEEEVIEYASVYVEEYNAFKKIGKLVNRSK